MRSLRLLAWITQFGISVAAPPVLCALLGDYLQRRYALGSWVLWVLILVGILSGVAGLAAIAAQPAAHQRGGRRKKTAQRL